MGSDHHEEQLQDPAPYLTEDPDSTPQPPVETSAHLLPIEALSWKDFERLCLRLAGRSANVVHTQLFGIEGQDQQGIDVFARRVDGRYDTWQCKRYQKSFTASNIHRVVQEFLDGKPSEDEDKFDWVSLTRRFCLCVTHPLDSVATTKAIEEEAKRLKNDGIEFVAFGLERLSEELRKHPDLVMLFFGKPWHDQFFGRVAEAAAPVSIEETEPSPATLVLLSDSEAKATHTLQATVDSAFELLEPSLQDLGPPHYATATEVVSSREALDDVLRHLCRARVVIADVTKFDPAVMLLLGVRSVVRRGLTILSMGGDYAVGTMAEIPFNLRDTNLVSHSATQHQKGGREPADLLSLRISRGIRESREPWYDDLGVFHAIRRLPSERRGIVPQIEGFLVLCSFSPEYTEKRWQDYCHLALKHRLKALRARKSLKHPPKLGVARSFELESPRVVSHAVLEFIRRAQVCIVDLTEWSPNVLFELGVRLATANQPRQTRLLLHVDDTLANANPQGKALTALLKPVRYGSVKDWKADKAFAQLLDPEEDVTSTAPIHPAKAHVHRVVARALELDAQPASVEVHREIASDADLYSRPPGQTKPAGLFPSNRGLVAREARAERERLLAIWAYLVHRFGLESVKKDPALRTHLNDALDVLFDRHDEELKPEESLWKALNEVADELDEE